jgi:hypothetical protein
MSERITIEDVRERAVNLNRRLNGSGRSVIPEQRNGSVALDEYSVNSENRFDACLRTITLGTKREIYDFLHAMMVGIDLSRAD